MLLSAGAFLVGTVVTGTGGVGVPAVGGGAVGVVTDCDIA